MKSCTHPAILLNRTRDSGEKGERKNCSKGNVSDSTLFVASRTEKIYVTVPLCYKLFGIPCQLRKILT